MRALLIFPATSYRADAHLRAAAARGITLCLASDLPVGRYGLEQRQVDFADIPRSLDALVDVEVDGVVAVDEKSAVVAAAFAERRGLRHHSLEGAIAARDKRRMREILSRAGVAVPRWGLVGEESDPIAFPCVVKPPMLTGSQGVIRADDPEGLDRALRRVAAILSHHPSPLRALPGFAQLLVEEFVPGREVAVDGIMRDGKLVPLAIFDKPDPLDGPFFEETIYLTPTRERDGVCAALWDTSERAARALGLCDGPIHVEIRIDPRGQRLVVIEIAARSIGGQCASVIDGLEELSLLQACGHEVSPRPMAGATGVMMIPVPRSGVLRRVDGLDAARAVDGIVSVNISIAVGEAVRRLPEGASYLGFVFARAPEPAVVEAALRRAHGLLSFELSPLLAVV